VELLALIGLSAYCGVSFVVGIRLLLLARRTGEIPERMIGIGFLAGGSIGYMLAVASMQLQDANPEMARRLFYLGMPLISLCAVCLFRFWQRVYHSDSKAAGWVVVLVGVTLVGCLAMQWATTEVGDNSAHNLWYRLQLFVQASAYAVNFYENTRFHLTLRRRASLGLAEPIVVNRVLMWAIASAVVSLQYAYSIWMVMTAAPGEKGSANPGIISFLGLTAAIVIVLAFFPPRAYRRWISAPSES
jgi:hypothetical protein